MEKYCKLMTPTKKTVAIKSQDTKQKKHWRGKEENKKSIPNFHEKNMTNMMPKRSLTNR